MCVYRYIYIYIHTHTYMYDLPANYLLSDLFEINLFSIDFYWVHKKRYRYHAKSAFNSKALNVCNWVGEGLTHLLNTITDDNILGFGSPQDE